jgi:hypothetical protein
MCIDTLHKGDNYDDNDNDDNNNNNNKITAGSKEVPGRNGL